MSRHLANVRSITVFFYGCIVVASGVWRVVSAEGGSTGLWFGVVMGSIAWLSAVFYRLGRIRLANVLAFSCIALVGGWFGYESFMKKGYANSESRQLVVIVLSVATAVVLCWLTNKSAIDATREVSRDGT